MSRSFEQIDYRLRPAKGVERRMMAEAFLRLRAFGSVETYRYIGMGSVYFSDFSLFHTVCGFQAMVSMENEEDPTKQKRFKFNVPLGQVDLKFGHSNDTLPTLPWDLRSVVWLDYDGVLTGEVLRDIKFLAGKLSSGSLLSLSVNANLKDEDGGGKPMLEVLKQRLGSEDKVPSHVAAASILKPQDVYRVYREILTQEVQDGLNDRNAGRPSGQKFVQEQVFFFKYQDGATMLTLGWIIFEEGQRATFNQCNFETLSFFARDEKPFLISPPLLTGAEIREIDRCDEAGTFRLLSDLPFPLPQIKKYQSLRRYWTLGNISDAV